jgi:hypothetical protein
MPAAGRTAPSKAITSSAINANVATERLGGLDAGGDATGAIQRLLALCGYWLDQKGSTYQLLPGSAHSLHVHTARPSGQGRYTTHLVRLALTRGQPRVVWGASRYTLCESSLDIITWQGRSETDHFDWVRIA